MKWGEELSDTYMAYIDASAYTTHVMFILMPNVGNILKLLTQRVAPML